MKQTSTNLMPDSKSIMSLINIQRQARSGDAESQYKLAGFLQKGRGVRKNAQHAFYWYQKAAQQGNLPAQFNVWYAYLTGEGAQPDEQLAAKWYARASLKNSSSTQSIVSQLIDSAAY
jgi:TPR repeat protein